MSAFMDPKERGIKEKSLKANGGSEWVWRTDTPMPTLPDATRTLATRR